MLVPRTLDSNRTTRFGEEMLSLRFSVCLILVLASISCSEARVLNQKELTDGLVGTKAGEAVVSAAGTMPGETPPGESKRLSPGGPDPQHHSRNLSTTVSRSISHA